MSSTAASQKSWKYKVMYEFYFLQIIASVRERTREKCSDWLFRVTANFRAQFNVDINNAWGGSNNLWVDLTLWLVIYQVT